MDIKLSIPSFRFITFHLHSFLFIVDTVIIVIILFPFLFSVINSILIQFDSILIVLITVINRLDSTRLESIFLIRLVTLNPNHNIVLLIN
mmetsp:Transcript_35449/g.40320  ORF Transcript_35449/g.40320 Transcript_35449/m.40320 type:complete len:90 (+) Transcript_35449:218-487(+)